MNRREFLKGSAAAIAASAVPAPAQAIYGTSPAITGLRAIDTGPGRITWVDSAYDERIVFREHEDDLVELAGFDLFTPPRS